MNSSLIHAIHSLFDDARCYLERLDDELYGCHQPQLSGASIGDHTRHFIEFYQCILEKAHPEFQSEDLVLCYDRRRRNKSIATSTRQALAMLDVLGEKLPEIEFHDTLWVEHTDYLIGKTWLFASSVERELLYNIEHTIHHLALIRIGLRTVAPDLRLPAHFGVAPSTLQFQATVTTAAN